MCKEGGGLPRFQIKQDVAQTMEQMMAALMGRVPRGKGNGGVGGSGSGSGGSGGDGFSMAGQSVNVPMYGPDRLDFSQSGGARGHQGRSGQARKLLAGQQPKSSVTPEKHRDSEHAKLAPESVPGKYQQAVKRYFSQEMAPVGAKSSKSP